MKKILFIIIALSLFACNKEKSNSVRAGQIDKKMITTDHNKSVQCKFLNEYEDNSENIKLDLNFNGNYDVMIISEVDTVRKSTSDDNVYAYKINILNLNTNFSLAEQPNSKYLFENHYPDEFTMMGTFPKLTTPIISKCDSVVNAVRSEITPFTTYLNENDVINSELNWQYSETLSIFHSNYEVAKYSVSNGGDSLIGYTHKKDFSCLSATKYDLVYIPFREQKKKTFVYGWIELLIEDFGKITVNKTAIQK